MPLSTKDRIIFAYQWAPALVIPLAILPAYVPSPWWLLLALIPLIAICVVSVVAYTGKAFTGYVPFLGLVYVIPVLDRFDPDRLERTLVHKRLNGIQIERDGAFTFYWGWLTNPEQRCEYEAEAFAKIVLWWLATGRTMWDQDTTVLTAYAEILSERYWLPNRYDVTYCREAILRYMPGRDD
jgi:hypothetical protein